MKKLNRKGFTLVELLAVIIVLAVILVVAAPAVLNTMNSSKKNAFKLYAERVVTNAQQMFLAYIADPSGTPEVIKGENVANTYCINFKNLGFTNAEKYEGFVLITSEVTPGIVQSNATYKIYLTDGIEFAYKGITSTLLTTAVCNDDNAPNCLYTDPSQLKLPDVATCYSSED